MGLFTMSASAISCTGAAAKTLAQLATASGKPAKIKYVAITFDGIDPTNVPALVLMGYYDAAVTTATSFTPVCIDGTGATSNLSSAKHTTTSEGSGVAAGVESYYFNPTTGFYLQEPLGEEFVIPPSSYWRLLVTPPDTVNACFVVRWED